MNYELNKLRNFIEQHLFLSDPGKPVMSAAAIKELELDLKEEEDRIKKAFNDAVFSGKPDPIIEGYIQNHQQNLVLMADELLEVMSLRQLSGFFTLSPKPSVLNLHKLVYFTVCRLLDFIEKYFYRYFDMDCKIPDGYRNLFNLEIKRDKLLIYAGLRRFKIDRALQGIIKGFFDSFSGEQSKELTYRRAVYIKNCLAELKQVIKNECGHNCTRKLCIALLYLNFNQPAFVLYCQRYMITQLNGIADALSRYKMLCGFLDYFSSFQVKPEAYYTMGWPTVKVILKSWLEAKVDEMKERPNFKLELPVMGRALKEAQKINTSFSVSQLGCYVQMMEQEGIYKENKKKDIIRITAGSFTSKGSEDISVKSLSNSCYHIEQADAAVVMDAFFRMGKRIEKLFFPK